MKTTSSKIWIRVAVSIFYKGNHYTTSGLKGKFYELKGKFYLYEKQDFPRKEIIGEIMSKMSCNKNRLK